MGLKSPEDIRRIDVYMFNMRKNRDIGFKTMYALNQRKSKTVAIICGGDGTVMWVISEFVKHKIDP